MATGDLTVWASLGEFVKHEDDFKGLDVQVLAISVEPPERGKWVEEKAEGPVPHPLRLEAGGHGALRGSIARVPQPRGRQHQHADLVLIDKTGTIRWIHQATNLRVRAAIEEDLAQARKLNRAFRFVSGSSNSFPNDESNVILADELCPRRTMDVHLSLPFSGRGTGCLRAVQGGVVVL